MAVRNGYSSGEDGWDSEEVDISLVSSLNIPIGDLQEEVKGSFWEIVSRHVVFIAFDHQFSTFSPYSYFQKSKGVV